MIDYVLALESLSKHYPLSGWQYRKRVIKAVDKLSFGLQQGQTLSIVGESGSGKSSLARQLVGIETPTDGRILIENQNVYSLTKSEQRHMFKKVRMIFQNPFSSLNPHARIGSILAEPLKINTQLNANERKELVASTLIKVGLREDHAQRFPHMFSGGQRQRIAIARAIMLNPKVIVADEPLSALDVSVQAQILNLLMELQEQMQLSYVFISHDLGVIEHISDQVLVMYRGQMMEYGNVEQIFESPKHPYTQTLLASTPTYRHTVNLPSPPSAKERKSRAQINEGCVFAYRCPFMQPECLQSQPKTRNFSGQRVTCHTPL